MSSKKKESTLLNLGLDEYRKGGDKPPIFM
jgi:hypothetical protein